MTGARGPGGPRRAMWRSASYGYLAAVYLFLLAPMVVVLVGSVNSAPSFPSPFQSFTLAWYQGIFERSEFVRAMLLSVRVGLGASGLATLLGLPLALVIARGDFPGRNALHSFFLMPLMIPQIAAGVALLQLFVLTGVPRGGTGLLLAHTVFVTPFVIRAAVASLHMADPAMEEAAMSLGARRWQTVLYVTVPLIRAGVTAGFLLAFIISFANVPLSVFLTAPGAESLPIRVLAYMESRLDPLIGAVGGLMILGVLAVFVFIEKVLKVRLLL